MLFAESNRWQSGQDPTTVGTDPFVSTTVSPSPYIQRSLLICLNDIFSTLFKLESSFVCLFVSNPPPSQVPVFLWRLWANVSIAEAAIYGWWLDDALGSSALPVQVAAPADSAVLKVTTYVLASQAVIVVASFATTLLSTSLVFNSTLLPLPGGLALYCLYAPVLPPFQQTASTMALNATFEVPAGQGWIFQLLLC
jgi:hypothetical protein